MECINVSARNHSICRSDIDHESSQSTKSEEITISFYENQIPPFVEAEMERLYENIYTSLSRFRIYGEMENASTYVVRKGDKVITLFLFRREQDEVKVLNKQITIDEAEILRFTNATFAAFKSVKIISFLAIQTAIRRLPFAHQRCKCLSDIVLALPSTEEGYQARLGKSTRTNIRRHMKKIERSFPSFCFEVYSKENVSEEHVRDIIKLSSARMALKNKPPYINEEETERILRLVKMYGFVGAVAIDGRVCAGALCYSVGANYFMHVIAHDPQYDDYKLGTICTYLTICECITRNGKEFRFMESSHRYKFDFLGAWLDFDCLTIYRSRADFLLNGDRVLKTAFRAYVRQAKLWLLLAERRDNFISRTAVGFLLVLRILKKFRSIVLERRK